jgi:hypothetical protein
MGAYQLHPRIELGIDFPITIYQAGNFGILTAQGFNDSGIAAAGLGDLRVVPRVIILDPDDVYVGLAVVPEIRLPTGDSSSFLGAVGVLFAPRLAAEIPVGPVRVIGNLGYRLRPNHAQYLNLFVQNEFTLGAGAMVSLPDIGKVTDIKVMGEMHLATPVEAPFTFDKADSLKTPWELLAGIRGRLQSSRWGAEVYLARGLGLQTGYGRETFRALFGVRYDFEFYDRDGDRVPDDTDACPEQAEDHDGFQDADGCPEPDNDGDGIPDNEDACPMEPGPREYDGCPDRDGDEIPDNGRA